MATKQRRGVTDAAKQRINVRMSAEAHQRLQIHSVMSGRAPGEILDGLVVAHCRDWKVQANVTARVIAIDRLDSAHEVNLPIAQAS